MLRHPGIALRQMVLGWLAAVCFAVALSQVPGAQAATSSPAPEEPVVKGPTGERIDRYFQWAEAFGFSGSVLVADPGGIVLYQGYGLANREQGIPNGPDHYYSFGSIAKQFTGAVVAKLHAEGKLDVHDSITKYLDDVPDDKRSITIHHLLTHTAGIPDYHALTDFQPMTREVAERNILKKELDFEPGSEFRYSNSGYTLAAAIAERVSGKPYVELIRTELFLPAGMPTTGFMGEAELWPDRKTPQIYRNDRDNKSPRTLHGPTWALLGNGGSVSNVYEMYRWDQALLGDDVVSAEAKKLMFTPFLNDYGYGWDIMPTARGTTVIKHDGGSTLGLSANFCRYVDEGMTTIVASNATVLGDLAIGHVTDRLAKLPFETTEPLAEPPEWADDDAARLRQLAGSYPCDDGGEFRVSRSGNLLLVRAFGATAVESLLSPAERSAVDQHLHDSRCRSIMRCLAEQRFDELAPLVVNETEKPGFAGIVRRIWERWTKEDGEYQSFKVLGTAPVWWNADPETATWIEIKFADKTRLARFHWSGERLFAIGGSAIAAPIICAMRRQDDGHFAIFDFHQGMVASADFTGGETEATATLTVRGPGGTVEATRSTAPSGD